MISKNRFLKSTNLLLQDNLILILYLRAWILLEKNSAGLETILYCKKY